jgi:hypothetical protein
LHHGRNDTIAGTVDIPVTKAGVEHSKHLGLGTPALIRPELRMMLPSESSEDTPRLIDRGLQLRMLPVCKEAGLSIAASRGHEGVSKRPRT